MNTTNNKTLPYTKAYKNDHRELGSTNSKFQLKVDHPHNHNPKYSQLGTKGK